MTSVLKIYLQSICTIICSDKYQVDVNTVDDVAETISLQSALNHINLQVEMHSGIPQTISRVIHG